MYYKYNIYAHITTYETCKYTMSENKNAHLPCYYHLCMTKIKKKKETFKKAK